MFSQEHKKKIQNARLQRTSPVSILYAVKATVAMWAEARIHF